ncbi:MAG: hypothetical protein IPO26_18990 [Saprospiraceae bacterium]|nr:hypothetical protein [Saprospiraceae bacterium]
MKAIDEWRDNPFNPHIIARSRPSAYMKWVVMRYLDNILDWGDYLYRQDTLETVNYATQLYVLAGHILGKRPQQIPKRGKIKPQTYLHLMNKLDAFSNAVVDMELVFPYSNQAIVSDAQYGEEIVYANIYGMASTNYFCIPNNPKLMGYWNTISERLYNIRHCLNIQGVFRKLSLFEPEIDPALLVAATAQGLSLASVLSDMNAPVPNYRFQYMLSKAFELCNEVKSLGNTLLSTKEKKDGEILSKMRSRHEVSMNNLIMEIKKKQLEEAQQSLANLNENRRSPVYRMSYYLQQIGEDLSKIPSEDAEFTEIADKIEAVLDESGLKLIELEKGKYTNEQLYTWMEGQIKALYYQSYKMAYDLAKKVEGLYRFERGLTSTNFIQFGYWNSTYDGLLSGEQLYNGLKQIEIAHQENRPHDYEITNKQVSLRKLQPDALLALRLNASCEFSIPEELFDLDFAGHYKRRIKTVSFLVQTILRK